MSTMIEFEEEEFTTQFNGQTVLRILQQLRPYWRWVAGFLITVLVVSFLESYFTYLSKRIIDEAIVARNVNALWELLTIYGGLILFQAVAVRPTAEHLERNTHLCILEETGDVNCSVCQDPMEAGQEIRTLLVCCHSFHRTCVDRWFQEHVTWPTCRHDVREECE
jgi:hypothetical protein